MKDKKEDKAKEVNQLAFIRKDEGIFFNLRDLGPLSDFPDTIKIPLETLYGSDSACKKMSATFIKVLCTQKLVVGMVTKKRLAQMVEKDPDYPTRNSRHLSGEEYKDFIRYISDFLIEWERIPKDRKPGIFRVIHPNILDYISDSLGINPNDIIYQQKKEILAFTEPKSSTPNIVNKDKISKKRKAELKMEPEIWDEFVDGFIFRVKHKDPELLARFLQENLKEHLLDNENVDQLEEIVSQHMERGSDLYEKTLDRLNIAIGKAEFEVLSIA